MKIKVQKVYGSAQLEMEIEAASLKEILFSAAIFTQKDRCVLCKQEEIGLEGNRDKDGNIYIKRKCRACTATSALGSYKTGGHFWHNWEKYQPKNQSPGSSQTSVPPPPPEEYALTDDDI